MKSSHCPLDQNCSPKRPTTTWDASWYDGVGRTNASADYGTNGGSSLTRPASVPARSDTVLVTTSEYNNAGNVISTFDPKNTETRFEYDAVGRETLKTNNYVASGFASDQNQKVWTTYSPDGQVKKPWWLRTATRAISRPAGQPIPSLAVS